MNIKFRKKLALCVLLSLMMALCPTAFATEKQSDMGDGIQPNAGTARWVFTKESETGPDLDYSAEYPVSHEYVGPTTFSCSVSETTEISYQGGLTAEIIKLVDASVSFTIKKSVTTTETAIYTVDAGKVGQVMFVPRVYTVTGTAKLMAVPGGMVQKKNVVATYPAAKGRVYLKDL